MGSSNPHQLKELRISDWDDPYELILVLSLDLGRVLEIREEPLLEPLNRLAEVQITAK